MASSGIREGAWDYLKWGHVKPIEKDGAIVAASILVYAGEEDEEYTSFITPEAYFALKEWMERRERAGEKVTKDSWLMRNLWDNRVCYGKGWATIPKKLKSSGVKVLMEHALYAQGIRTTLPAGKRRHEFQAVHGYRKFFKSHAEQVMRPINVEILMGHSTGISDSYYRPTSKDLLEDYLKAVPLLTVSEAEHAKNQMQAQEKKHRLDMLSINEQMARMQDQIQIAIAQVSAAKNEVSAADRQSQSDKLGT
jgi:hypothetical protein